MNKELIEKLAQEKAWQEYEKACTILVKEFANKQGFGEWEWIGDESNVADFGGGIVFNTYEIATDLRLNAPKGEISKWWNTYFDSEDEFSYSSWLKGYRPYDWDEIKDKI